jgi:dynein heavy chain
MYGGRVIDSYDRRIIRTYMQEYFGDFVFDYVQPFHFFLETNKSLKYDYFIPEIRDLLSVKESPQFTIFRDLYLAYIDQLPLYNPPDVLGLHANAEINYLIKTANEIYSNMLDIQPEQNEMENNSSRERKKSFSEQVFEFRFLLEFVRSLIDDILHEIPPKKDLDLIKQKFKQRLTPLTIVLFQEIQRFNLLTSIMWKSMNELKQALNGQISFSFELDEIKKSLYHGYIPLLWRSYAPQTKKSLSNWIEHFRQRNQQYEKWIQDGKKLIIKFIIRSII